MSRRKYENEKLSSMQRLESWIGPNETVHYRKCLICLYNNSKLDETPFIIVCIVC